MSLSHIIILGIVLVIAVPPEKLPELMRNLGRLFNDLRRNTSGVWDEIKKDASVDPISFYNTNTTQNTHPPPEQTVTENIVADVAEKKPETQKDPKNDSNT